MATETAAPAQAGHPTEEIVRDRLYIGGEWVEPTGTATIEVIDSTTEQVIGRIPEGTPEDVDRAVSRGARRVRGVARGPCRAARGGLHRDQRGAGRARGGDRGPDRGGGRDAAGAGADDPGGTAGDGLRLDGAGRRPRSPGRSRSATRWSSASRSEWSARSRRGTTRCIRSARRSAPALAAGCTVVAEAERGRRR